jgi:hypothetical protein
LRIYNEQSMKYLKIKSFLHIHFCNIDIIFGKDECVDRLDVTLKKMFRDFKIIMLELFY